MSAAQVPERNAYTDFFSRWGIVSRKDATGFGRQAQDSKRVLGVGYHFVVPSDRLEGEPPEGEREFWLKPDAADDEVAALLRKVDGILCSEHLHWHPRLAKIAHENGVKTACVINWEWFKPWEEGFKYCSLIVCPTRFSETVVANYGFENRAFLPWALDLSQFKKRTITGPARSFFHNAGLVDRDDRKGTRDTILAFKRVKRADVRLVVRAQKEVPLPELDERIEVRFGNLAQPSALYDSGDVAIQPSKMEGIGYMVIEPVCCGIPTITVNYPPMNEFVAQPEMRTKLRWFKRKAYASRWVKHAHLRLPDLSDLARRIEFCADHDMAEISAQNRAFAEEHFNRERLQKLWFEALSRL